MPTRQPSIHGLKADLFKVLGHPVRVRIIDLLREGERKVGDLQTALELDTSGTSQHLGALRRAGLVETRRQGTTIYYRLRDPRMLQLLAVAGQVLSANLAETRALLEELSAEAHPGRSTHPRPTRRAEKRIARS